MRTYLLCGMFCILGFLAMGMQLGLFGNQRKLTNYLPEFTAEKKPATSRAKFPDALAPVAQAEPVDAAAAFEPDDRPHKMVFLKTNGAIHPWHDSHSGYHEDWWTSTVEEAELVVVVGNSRKIQVSFHKYANGAPPITRYQFELEASLVEAKTGRVLVNRKFQNIPRAIRQVESWETTAIGAPVSYHTVFRWAEGIARFGPPIEPVTTPLITVVKD